MSDPGDLPVFLVLSVLARGDADGLEFVGARRARRFPGGTREAGTLVTKHFLDRLNPGDREIVAMVLDDTGKEMVRYGFPNRARVCYGCARSHAHRRTFEVYRKLPKTRQFDVRFPEVGAAVVFLRAQVERDARISMEPLLAVLLERGEGSPAIDPAVVLRQFHGQKMSVVGVPFARDSDEKVEKRADDEPHGYLKDVWRLRRNVDTEHRFDVVIIGDGFTERGMGAYRELAHGIVDRLRKSPPFEGLDDKINYHIIEAVSEQSGIDGFSASRKKGGVRPKKAHQRRTYFGFKSDPYDFGEPGFFVVGPMARIRNATARATGSWSEVDLIVAIMNVPYDGGCGYLDHRLAVVSKHPQEPWKDFFGRTLHECGHAVCGLSEEYITSDQFEPGERYPNMATWLQKESENVWWHGLAREDETKNGTFLAIHQYEDRLMPKKGFLIPAFDDPGMTHMLGLFWGTQCVRGELDFPADVDPQDMAPEELRRAYAAAQYYFRPMARCAMRDIDDPYCRVCEHVIEESINAAAEGRPRSGPRGLAIPNPARFKPPPTPGT